MSNQKVEQITWVWCSVSVLSKKYQQQLEIGNDDDNDDPLKPEFHSMSICFRNFCSRRSKYIHYTRYATVHQLNIKEYIFIFIRLTFCLIPMVCTLYIVYTCFWSDDNNKRLQEIPNNKQRRTKLANKIEKQRKKTQRNLINKS